MAYIDADKLLKSVNNYQEGAKAALNPTDGDADYYKGKIDACKDMQEFITALLQELPKDTDILRTKLVNLLVGNDIQEDKAKYLADRISDTYGVQRYMDGICDTANAYEHEQPEMDLDKEIDEHVIYMPHGEFASDNERQEDVEWARKEFRYFFELGLNARKQ